MDQESTASHQRVRELCQALVRTESLSGEEAAVADIVEAEAHALGFDQVERDSLARRLSST